MSCHICGKEAVDRCYTCGNLFCHEHGTTNCVRCETGIAAGDNRADRISASRLREERGRHAWWRAQQAEDYEPPSCHVCHGLARRVCRNCRLYYCSDHAGSANLCQTCGRSSILGVVCLLGSMAVMGALLLWAFLVENTGHQTRELVLSLFGYSLTFLAIYLVFALSCKKLLQKARRPGWPGLVPVYNLILLLKLAGKPAWWIVLYPLLIACPPLVIALNILVGLGLARNFGKTIGFGVGLGLAWIIFLPILAFGDAEYQPAYEGTSHA